MNTTQEAAASASYSQRFLRKAQVLQLVPVSRKTLKRWEHDGLFPAAQRAAPGSRAVLYPAAAVHAWLAKHGGALPQIADN